MESFDPNTARKVWQRVQATPQCRLSREELRLMLLSAAQTAAVYRYLTGTLSGRLKDTVRELLTDSRREISTLQGIGRLCGHSVTIPEQPAPKEPPRQCLRRCYYQGRKAAADYTARSIDPDFGIVFQELARMQTAACVSLTQLLGAMG